MDEPTAYNVRVFSLAHILYNVCKKRLDYLQSITGDQHTQDIDDLNLKLEILLPLVAETSSKVFRTRINQVNQDQKSFDLEDSKSLRQVDSNGQELKVNFIGQDLMQGETLNIEDAFKVETRFNKDGKRYRAEKMEEREKRALLLTEAENQDPQSDDLGQKRRRRRISKSD